MFEKPIQDLVATPFVEGRLSRRHVMQSLLGVCAAAILVKHSGADTRKDLVEVNGWILRRSDLA